MEVNRNSKITVQITIIVACAMALFSAWVIYSNLNTQVMRNTSDIQVLYQLDKEKTDWRNQTENTITRIETKLISIEKWIDEITEYIKTK
jgi:hypothetical protein